MEIELPKHWDSIETEFPLIPEGDYAVKVAEVKLDSPTLIHMRFRITDDGDSPNRLLFKDYDIGSDDDKIRPFKEFMEAIGVTANNGRIDPARFIDMELRVRVKHNESNGKIYANVSRHMPTESILNVD